MVPLFSYVYIVRIVYYNTLGGIELGIACAFSAPFGDKFAIGSEFLNAIISLVDNVDTAARVDRYAAWLIEFTVSISTAPSGD